jgi:hypothetical protein
MGWFQFPRQMPDVPNLREIREKAAEGIRTLDLLHGKRLGGTRRETQDSAAESHPPHPSVTC